MRSKADALENRLKELLDKTNERLDETKKAKSTAKEYNEMIDEIKKRTAELEKKAKEPVELVADVEKVKRELVEVEVRGDVSYFSFFLFGDAWKRPIETLF